LEGRATHVGEKAANRLDRTADDSGIAFRVGLSVTGPVYLHSLEWERRAPGVLAVRDLALLDLGHPTARTRAGVSSAKNFEGRLATLSVSHPDPLGVVTTGTRDWVDYEVSSRLTILPEPGCWSRRQGRGHRKLHRGRIRRGHLSIDRAAQLRADRARDRPRSRSGWIRRYDVRLECSGLIVRARVDGRFVVSATTRRLAGGGAASSSTPEP